ncbi:5907_t:CDS:2 [Paraglomus brasilianum]|uniref:5907_t:CDS:1 n=1 Tax=Paraglomus brasilianum TaxID=144538 RepID=A0A9N9CB17_9GLOM|nr:5907_t:CDS:2 [Paraglomus brasilianum]
MDWFDELQQLLNAAASITYQPMQQEYVDSSSLYGDVLINSQQYYQLSLNPSQLPTNVYVFTSGDLPTYPILQSTNEQQMAAYIDNSIQQQNDTLSTRQNLLTHRQQRWLSQHPYSRQREVQTPNKFFTPPMQSEHQLDRQNSVQNMLGVFPIEQSESEYVQSQVYPPTGNPSMSQSQGDIHQVSQPQNNFHQLGNGFPDKPSQMETDERSLQSQKLE